MDYMLAYMKYSKIFPWEIPCYLLRGGENVKSGKTSVAMYVYKYISIRELELAKLGVLGRLINQSSLNQIFAELIYSFRPQMLMVNPCTLLITNTIQSY